MKNKMSQTTPEQSLELAKAMMLENLEATHTIFAYSYHPQERAEFKERKELIKNLTLSNVNTTIDDLRNVVDENLNKYISISLSKAFTILEHNNTVSLIIKRNGIVGLVQTTSDEEDNFDESVNILVDDYNNSFGFGDEESEDIGWYDIVDTSILRNHWYLIILFDMCDTMPTPELLNQWDNKRIQLN